MQNKPNTALLVMDLQNQILVRLTDSTALVANAAKAIAKARAAHIPVIHVGLQFRAGFVDVSPNNRSFAALSQGMGAPLLDAPTYMPELTPAADDIVVIKKRVSAFSGSDLEVVLRSMHITHLVLTGLATGGIVLSTLREAADKDYILTVLSDVCADMDHEVHQVLMGKVFPRQATVTTVDGWAV